MSSARRMRRAGIIAAPLVIGALVAVVVWPKDHVPSRPRASAPLASSSAAPSTGYPGMPPVVDPKNIYSEAEPGHVSPQHRADPFRVYVPNGKSNSVSVIDPAARSVITTFKTLAEPQHIVPAYDLSTL